MSVDSLQHGRRRLGAILACSSIAICATAIRFWCKMSLKSGIHADDWWILAALITGLGAQAALLWDLRDGSDGKDVGELIAELMEAPSPENVRALRNYLVAVVISFSLTYVVLFQIKISICLLYRRIFSSPDLRRICIVLMGISTAWFIATEVGNLAICLPIDVPKEVSPGELNSGMCMNFQSFFLPTGISELVIDAAILLLPVKVVFGLHMPTRTKILVSGIFLLGGFALITAVLRVYYTYSPNGTFGRFNDAEIWAEVHFAIAVLCACLPVYRPLLDKVNKLLSNTIGHCTFMTSRLQRHLCWSGPRHTQASESTQTEDVSDQQTRQNSDASSDFPSSRATWMSKESTRDLVAGSAQWTHSITAGDTQVSQYHDPARPLSIMRTTNIDIV